MEFTISFDQTISLLILTGLLVSTVLIFKWKSKPKEIKGDF